MTWVVECWIMHGKDTTVHCLHTDKQAAANLTPSWAMMSTEVNCLTFS